MPRLLDQRAGCHPKRAILYVRCVSNYLLARGTEFIPLDLEFPMILPTSIQVFSCAKLFHCESGCSTYNICRRYTEIDKMPRVRWILNTFHLAPEKQLIPLESTLLPYLSRTQPSLAQTSSSSNHHTVHIDLNIPEKKAVLLGLNPLISCHLFSTSISRDEADFEGFW